MSDDFSTKHGDRWQKPDADGEPSPPWYVASINGPNGVRLAKLSFMGDLRDQTGAVGSVLRETRIGLSGPGPCRSMIYVTVAELFTEWRRVEAEVIPFKRSK